jgi:hypothetical protein
MERLQSEPLSASLTGPLPTVLVGARVAWPDYLRQQAELLWGADAASHGVRQLAKRLCGDGPKNPRERAKKIYRWVQSNIEESGNPWTSASHTLARRSGARINLLRALLRQCRLGPFQTLLIWPRQREIPDRGIPPLSEFSQRVLRLSLPRGQGTGKGSGQGQASVYLLPQLQQAPFGYLPPMLQGALAVSPDQPDAAPRRTPTQPDADGRDTHLTVTLHPSGRATITGREKLRGLLALQFRAALRRVPERRLRQHLERAFFGRHFAGATLKSLRFARQKALDQPLELHYQLEVPAFAQVQGRRLVLRSGFFPARIGRLFGRLPSRRLALRLGPVGPTRLTLEVRPPADHRAVELPTAATLKSPFGRFTLKATRAGQAVRIQRVHHVPFRLVPPKDYPAFARFGGQVDQAEQVTIVFQR